VLSLWCGLILVSLAVAATESYRAWRMGMELSRRLEESQVRLRMNGGLTLKGGSAGLPFCLNILMALYKGRPRATRRSWIWRRLFCQMHSESKFWAGTGVITPNGSLLPVVLAPKLRASLKHDQIRHVITPRQREASARFIDQLAEGSAVAVRKEGATELSFPEMRVGFAAEKPRLRIHRCRHAGHAMMALGGFSDRWQMASNAFALIVSVIMVAALPDLRSVLLPHPAPVAVEPASPSPYYVWVSLNTTRPEYFRAVLESGYWSNRRADVKQYSGVNASVRAEIQLHRLIGSAASNDDDGAVWIERRRRFLTREFLPGERVGRYSISYLTRLGHE
ncbi:MAG TPA: hypothetical protein VK615_10140, partial [Candidatus Binatia bacterium]|nr:hypothetical protein [Candidatus Binatia bacterium]